mmetsp:Transcript_58802/g.164185  ORF Transcript_58802/g.164185 Transcript_58802/m.164185 type:complete len:109 (+) Transcript_58802:2180-2506(+)
MITIFCTARCAVGLCATAAADAWLGETGDRPLPFRTTILGDVTLVSETRAAPGDCPPERRRWEDATDERGPLSDIASPRGRGPAKAGKPAQERGLTCDEHVMEIGLPL